ncbi:mitochondrial carrier domain-containing protein [Triangularia verruculosa]|uniref:Mitochondrial carrier domain-containing protein n=1 Tax=Triangularia verruculosa TaxID=2587418 RepID=A0AAN7B1T7_9PEZI|nr:mitochondrial carrier domain-containing protein [Triangularia verruculosa]
MGMLADDAQTPDFRQNHDRMAGLASPAVAVEPPNDPVEITTVQKMLSATSGSLVTGLLVTPLDVVRVRWQAQGLSKPAPQPLTADFSKLALSSSTPFRPSNLGVTACCREVFFANNNSELCVVGPRVQGVGSPAIECAVEHNQQRTFTSTFDGLRKIARNEGVTTLWRGLSPTLVMAVPANIIYLTGYDWLRLNPASPIQRARVRDDMAPLMAGIAARMVAAAVVSPIELFRTRLQAAQGGTSSEHLADTLRGVKEMVSTHGYRSLWRGLTLTLWRDVPFSGMYWWGYETIRGKLTDARERGRPTTLEMDLDRDAQRSSKARHRRRSQSRENHAETFTDSFIAGAASGAFASVATMPFDVGKTRTQVFRDSNSAASAVKNAASAAAAAPEEQSMTRLLWHIFRTEGTGGLFKGCVPRTLKVAPACAVMISSYEVGKRVFRGANEKRALREVAGEERG